MFSARVWQLKGVPLTGIEWSCGVIRARFWSCEIFPINGHDHMCEGQGVYPTTHIKWHRNSCSIKRGRILFYKTWTHEEWYCIVWVAPRLVCVCWNIKYQNDTYQCYEKGLMGGNWSWVKILEEQDFLLGRVETSRVGGWCRVKKGGRPGTRILSVLMLWSHAAMYF